ncbi:MAG: cyclopropane fatty acyl phospholipid synthase, partial [Patescibacteria group bacterium]
NSPAGEAKNLDEAQEAKLDLVCKKIGLKSGQRILDIGCGWGSFVKYAAEKYGVSAVGVTVSKEQAELAKKLCAGLPIEILLTDYRNITGEFDHIVSLGMFEHVGYKNYRAYFEVVARHLKDSGLFLLHTIGRNFSAKVTDAWTEKYIFPNSMLPSIKQIGEAIEGLFVMEDWHNFGTDYDKTVIAWLENFNQGWENLKEKYGERFYRMWTYWLYSSQVAFRVRKMQVWQIVLSKKGVPGGYRSIR